MNAQQAPLKLLNIGCGNTFHNDWVNLDVTPAHPDVLAYDLRLGIPFADDSFDVIYHSHVLEHLERPYAEHLLRECFRALKPDGLLRMAVPDLENIARSYLRALDDARAGDADARERHHWMIVELLDQLCRAKSGGEMLRWWAKHPLPQENFILSRMGAEMANAVEQLHRSPPEPEKNRTPLPVPDPNFAQSGELHRWMYDDLSLGSLLREMGFENILRRAHDASMCPRILRYGLDALDDGTPRKPDSFFMEACKPSGNGVEPLRVALLCAADHGGAGTAALRLHSALRGINVRAEEEKLVSHFYCAAQKSTEEAVHLLPGRGAAGRILPLDDGAAALSGLAPCRERIEQALKSYPKRPAGREYFSLPQSCCDPAKTPLFEDFDVVNLHWMSGMFDPALAPETLRDRPVVWTLHDMAAFTGGCHYSAGCARFMEQCGRCPELGSDDPKDLSFETWRARMGAYRALNLRIVCPSAWLAGQARQSSLLGRFPIQVIPYAQPLNIFHPLRRDALRRSLDIAPEDCVVLFAAQHLHNERKGGAYLVEALRFLAQQPLSARLRLFLLGSHPPAVFFQLKLRVASVGHVDTPQQMAALYNAADAVLVPSLEDNLPNVICESLGCGTPVVAFAAGGIPEMLRHKETGWLAPVRDAAGLAAGVTWADEAKNDDAVRLRCRAFALENWNPAARASEYARLFAAIARRRHGGKTCPT